MTRYYNPRIRSHGQTIDTPRGPVDTVVIERALCGLPVRPSRVEAAYLMTFIPPGCDRTLTARVAEALGVQLKSVERQSRRHHDPAGGVR